MKLLLKIHSKDRHYLTLQRKRKYYRRVSKSSSSSSSASSQSSLVNSSSSPVDIFGRSAPYPVPTPGAYSTARWHLTNAPMVPAFMLLAGFPNLLPYAADVFAINFLASLAPWRP